MPPECKWQGDAVRVVSLDAPVRPSGHESATGSFTARHYLRKVDHHLNSCRQTTVPSVAPLALQSPLLGFHSVTLIAIDSE